MTDKLKILDKIRKLLALSESSNPHEAAMAAGRAADLMTRHQVAEAELDLGEEGSNDVTEAGAERMRQKVAWKGTLIYGLAKAFGCSSYWNRSSQSGVSLRLVGRKSDIDAALYMYQYLTKEVERLTNQAWEVAWQIDTARVWKGSFRKGCARTISDRLIAARAETIRDLRNEGKSTTALIKISDALTIYVKKLGLRAGRMAAAGSSDGYGAGKRAGKSVDIGGSKKGLGGPRKQLKA